MRFLCCFPFGNLDLLTLHIYDRIRHVKCGEERPNCQQCSKTGRSCDGYEDKLNARRHLQTPPYSSPSVSGSLAQKRAPRCGGKYDEMHSFEFFHSEFRPAFFNALISSPYKLGPTMHNLGPRFSGSYDESRSFDFFQSELGPTVFEAFSLTAVNKLTMQLSHSDSTVKHAVVALGSLGEQLLKDRSLSPRTLDRDKRLQFAHLQNATAIQQLRRQLSDGEQQSIEMTLVSCFLFILFDFLLGDDVSSHAHLKAGLKIVRSYYSVETDGTIPATQENLVTPSALVVQDFAHIFTVMDLHAAIWLGLSSFQSPPLVDVSNNIFVGEPIRVFKTLEDASESLSFQLMRIHVFHHFLTGYSSTAYEIGLPFHVQARRERLLYDLRSWPLALDALLNTTCFPSESARRIALMRMNYFSIFINASTSLQPCQSDKYRKYTTIFNEILTLARTILRPATAESRAHLLRIITLNNAERDPNNLPMFAFVTGAIQPLSMIADRCVDTELCLEAIELLEERPWREGAWDSTVMAAIARRKLKERSEDRLL